MAYVRVRNQMEFLFFPVGSKGVPIPEKASWEIEVKIKVGH